MLMLGSLPQTLSRHSQTSTGAPYCSEYEKSLIGQHSSKTTFSLSAPFIHSVVRPITMCDRFGRSHVTIKNA